MLFIANKIAIQIEQMKTKFLKTNLLGLFVLYLTSFAHAQMPQVEWTKAIGGTGNDRANSVETDKSGNIILVGRFQSPTIKLDNLTLSKTKADSAEVSDIFIIKLDKSGSALWAIAAGDKGDDHATSCITDKKGNIYVVGWFESKTLKFGNITLQNKTEKGSDMFVAKFSPKGECIWANNAGGEGGNGDYSSIALDKDDNVLVSGVAGAVMDFGDGVKFMNEKSGMYLAKYTNEGQLLWAESAVGGGEAQGIGTDADGNIFIGGFFTKLISFDEITINSNTEDRSDAFVAKYSPDGKVVWVRNFGGEGGEIVSCETDPFGNVYIAGLFFSKMITTESDTIINNGSMNSFIAKFDTDGRLLWMRSAGGNNGEGPATATREFYLDQKGNAFCTGSNWSEFSFAGQTIKPIAGSEDIFLLKYDTNGNEVWAVVYGGSGRNAGRGITTDKTGDILLTGSFDEKQLKVGDYTLTNAGDSDIFIVKFSQ
jgi:hypothetical protein